MRKRQPEPVVRKTEDMSAWFKASIPTLHEKMMEDVSTSRVSKQAEDFRNFQKKREEQGISVYGDLYNDL